jgi:hypothetical protein
MKTLISKKIEEKEITEVIADKCTLSGFKKVSIRDLYSKIYEHDGVFQTKLKRSFDAMVEPDVVTNAIVHAITNTYPKIRYQVGYSLCMHTTVLKWLS